MRTRWRAHCSQRPTRSRSIVGRCLEVSVLRSPRSACEEAVVSGGAAIRVYTERMKVVKVRRVGNSNVISIPREFEARGYAPGSSVLVEGLPGGALGVMSREKG